MVRRQIGQHPHLVYTSKNSQDFVTEGQKKIIVHDLCPVEPHQIGKKSKRCRRFFTTPYIFLNLVDGKTL